MSAAEMNPWPKARDLENNGREGQIARRFAEEETTEDEDPFAGAEIVLDELMARQLELNVRRPRRLEFREAAGGREERREAGGGAQDDDPTLWLYRDRTAALLRRFFRFSIEVGRLPSLLGREFFRTRVTTYRVGTFEDAVIFVRDVERCLEQLDGAEIVLLGKIVFEDFTHSQAAEWMQSQRRTVGRRLPEALDHLSKIFLENGILARLPSKFPKREKACQEA